MGCDVSCNGVPYFEINQNQSQVPVNIFLDNLERNFNSNAPYSHRVQNFQSFEMGMDEKITDETQMRKELQRLIDRFDVTNGSWVILQKGSSFQKINLSTGGDEGIDGKWCRKVLIRFLIRLRECRIKILLVGKKTKKI